MGQLDIDRTYFPDPKGMNDSCKSMGMHSIISVWPRFERESRYFDMLATKGWLLQGQGRQRRRRPADPLRPRRRAARQHQSRCARLVLGQDPRQYRSARASTGSGSTRPSRISCPTAISISIGSGDRYHNLFPLVHTDERRGRLGARPARLAQPDPRARRLSRRAAQRRAVLVVGHPGDLGGAAAPGADRARLHRDAAWPIGAATPAAGSGRTAPRREHAAAARSGRRDRDGAGLYRLSRAVHALVRSTTASRRRCASTASARRRRSGNMARRPSRCSPSS